MLQAEPLSHPGASDTIAFQAVGSEFAVIVTDAAGRITEWSDAATELYGWTAAEVIGRAMRNFMVSESARNTADEIVSRLAGGESWSGSLMLQRADGAPVLASMTAIPVLTDGRTSAIVTTSRVAEPRRASSTVLIVDDDIPIAGLLREVLIEEGYAVHVASTPARGLEFAKLEEPRLVIFDYRMDGMDGTEFFRQLRALGVSAPAIMCSGWRDGAKVAGQLGVSFLEKPFDLDDMIGLLRRVGGEP